MRRSALLLAVIALPWPLRAAALPGFDERVRLAYELELVLDRHRTTPGAREQLARRVAPGALAPRVARMLAASEARGIGRAELAREAARIRASTKDPALLAELLAVLGNDPLLVEECLARPALAARAPAAGGSFREYFPAPRSGHVAAWTGSEMLVFGGDGRTGARFDPATGLWRPMAVDVAATPNGEWAEGVWSGSELIVYQLDGRGGRYDPVADAWAALPPSGLAPRDESSCTWTGSEMVVWGGRYGTGIFATGAAYDPVADRWRLTAATGAPSRRYDHIAVFTGSEMIVHGGRNLTTRLGDGAAWDPATNSWRTISTGPAISQHQGVWSGSLVLVWEAAGGFRYDPLGDAWSPMQSTGAPQVGNGAGVTWTGSEMIVWGGGGAAGGARYEPLADAWTPMAASGIPGRSGHAQVWTGTELVAWGGGAGITLRDDGGRYDPALDAWTPIEGASARPPGSWKAASVWTGAELIVWGGLTYLGYDADSGGRYVPATDSWHLLPQGGASPSPRDAHTMVWSGSEAIVWGGRVNNAGFADGGRYDPVTDAWAPLRTQGAPLPRWGHTAVWSGSEMIVWGGWVTGGGITDTGGRYDPGADAWTPTSMSGAPAARPEHVAVWSGQEMIVWGGYPEFGNGGRYDPSSDSWSPVATAGGPHTGRWAQAVWTGSRMLVWGGGGSGFPGGRYDPQLDSWSPMTAVGSPEPATMAAHAWSGRELLVWSGRDALGVDLATGGRYDPSADLWSPIAASGAPPLRFSASGAWTGRLFLVWGGREGGLLPRDGGVYDPLVDSWTSVAGAGNVLAGMPDGGSAAYGALVAGYRSDGTATPTAFDAFPLFGGHGLTIASDDVDAGGFPEVVAGMGPGASFLSQVRLYSRDGVETTAARVIAYGVGGRGVNVGAGAIDGSAATAMLTGPGASPSYGPHVRAFRFTSGASLPIAKVSFYAYGTLRYGAQASGGDTDRDGFAEILSAPGPGAVFGPHVRGFDYDGIVLRPLPSVSFFAYQTPRYGVEAAPGDTDRDGFAEILTGPGPSSVFAPQLRGFDVDGGSVTSIARINAIAFLGARYGLRVAAGDLEPDGDAEIVCGAGPDPGFGTRMVAFDDDGQALSPIPALSLDPFGLSFGLEIAVGELAY